MKELDRCLHAIESDVSLVEQERCDIEDAKLFGFSRPSLYSSIYCLRGKILTKMDNRPLAVKAMRLAVILDPLNHSALDYLMHHLSLTGGEQERLLAQIEEHHRLLPFSKDTLAATLLLYRNCHEAESANTGDSMLSTASDATTENRPIGHTRSPSPRQASAMNDLDAVEWQQLKRRFATNSDVMVAHAKRMLSVGAFEVIIISVENWCFCP